MRRFPRALGATGAHIRRTISAGLIVTLPLAITAVILNLVVDWFDPLLKPAFDNVLGPDQYREGMGIGALVVLVYLAGLLTTHVLGRRFIDYGHRIVGAVPVVRSIYNTLLQATEMLSVDTSTKKYSGVVLVDFPKEGSKAIGLVTSHVSDVEGKPSLAVFVPTTPVPTSGFLLIIPEESAIPVDVTVDEAMKLIVSGGILTPQAVLHPRPDGLIPASPPLAGEPRISNGQVDNSLHTSPIEPVRFVVFRASSRDQAWRLANLDSYRGL